MLRTRGEVTTYAEFARGLQTDILWCWCFGNLVLAITKSYQQCSFQKSPITSLNRSSRNRKPMKWRLCIITWLFTVHRSQALFTDRKTLFLMKKPERYAWNTILTRFVALSMKFMSLRVYILWSLAGKSHGTISKLSRSSTKAKERLVFRVCMNWPRFFASRYDWFI